MGERKRLSKRMDGKREDDNYDKFIDDNVINKYLLILEIKLSIEESLTSNSGSDISDLFLEARLPKVCRFDKLHKNTCSYKCSWECWCSLATATKN